MLAIITLVEWNSLGRDPMAPQILSPFIGRDITIYDAAGSAPKPVEFQEALQHSVATHNSSRIEVAFVFDGPFFLLCFFTPIVVFRAMGCIATKFLSKHSPANGN